MKQKLIVIAALALMLTTSPALAQEVRVRTGVDASTTPVRTRVQAEFEARRASSSERRVELQLNIAKKRAANTARVLSATVGRLERIILRLESRIAKIKAEGGVVAESESHVALAKEHLNLAKTSIAVFTSVEFSSENTVRANFDRVKGIAAEAKGHIREAHTHLMMALRTLKPGQAQRATSTSQ